MKTQKGITLIALVITIIVMMILVGVSVSVALNSGLFKAAQGAGKNTQIAAEKETALSSGMINVQGIGETSIDDYVESLKGTAAGGGSGETSGAGGDKEYITTDESYVGCYADVNGDGTPDGVIYADLAFAGNGAGFKSYYVDGKHKDVFDNEETGKEVIVAEEGVENDRFYVMKLDDEPFGGSWYASKVFDGSQSFDANWEGIDVDTPTTFGKGKANTEKMLGIWKADTAKNNGDIWGKIEENSKWFVPSYDEWLAFADALIKDTENAMETYGMSMLYWSSSIDANQKSNAYMIAFDHFGGGTDWLASPYLSIRLSTTF